MDFSSLGDQKEMKQHIPGAERKDLSTLNSIASENIVQEWKENQDIVRQSKTAFVGSRPTLKTKEVLQTEESLKLQEGTT